ncbi:hypothetical protein EJB05_38479, partial [Eragrostis curvula]
MGARGPDGGETRTWPWWAAASAAQVAVGAAWFRRGRGGAAFAMPFKAFSIASLFVGAGATAVAAGVSAAGIGSVEKMKGVGASIRRWMGAPPRRVGGD